MLSMTTPARQRTTCGPAAMTAAPRSSTRWCDSRPEIPPGEVRRGRHALSASATKRHRHCVHAPSRGSVDARHRVEARKRGCAPSRGSAEAWMHAIVRMRAIARNHGSATPPPPRRRGAAAPRRIASQQKKNEMEPGGVEPPCRISPLGVSTRVSGCLFSTAAPPTGGLCRSPAPG